MRSQVSLVPDADAAQHIAKRGMPSAWWCKDNYIPSTVTEFVLKAPPNRELPRERAPSAVSTHTLIIEAHLQQINSYKSFMHSTIRRQHTHRYSQASRFIHIMRPAIP